MRRAGIAMKASPPCDNSSILGDGDALNVPIAEESTSPSEKPVLGVDFDVCSDSIALLYQLTRCTRLRQFHVPHV
jgi:hypothetical protein